MPVNRLTDNVYLEVGLETTDIAGPISATSKGIDMAAYDTALFVVEVGTYDGGDDLTCQVMQSATEDMAAPAALSAAFTLTTPTDGERFAFNVISSAKLALNYRYVALKVTGGAAISGDDVTIAQMAFNARKRHENRNAYEGIDASVT